MILFFDTSALVKFFHREEGTDVVVSLISDLKNELWVSELARLEFIHAPSRFFQDFCKLKNFFQRNSRDPIVQVVFLIAGIDDPQMFQVQVFNGNVHGPFSAGSICVFKFKTKPLPGD